MIVRAPPWSGLTMTAPPELYRIHQTPSKVIPGCRPWHTWTIFELPVESSTKINKYGQTVPHQGQDLTSWRTCSVCKKSDFIPTQHNVPRNTRETPGFVPVLQEKNLSHLQICINLMKIKPIIDRGAHEHKQGQPMDDHQPPDDPWNQSGVSPKRSVQKTTWAQPDVAKVLINEIISLSTTPYSDMGRFLELCSGKTPGRLRGVYAVPGNKHSLAQMWQTPYTIYDLFGHWNGT